ncbi:hypothetical protein LC1Hm_2108 [Halomicrobium sp. LC1Hm]|nr:hypothetical protein LC1Hm_2108 [Halomicrobium sp. LC1Hm]
MKYFLGRCGLAYLVNQHPHREEKHHEERDLVKRVWNRESSITNPKNNPDNT